MFTANRGLILGVLDQGHLGSCVFNAVTQVLRASHVKQGVANPELASRLALYYLARATVGESDVDAGSHIRLAFQTINRFGFCPESAWPYTDEGVMWKTPPSKDTYRRSFDQKAMGPTPYFRIYDEGDARITAIMQALAAGRPVAFGTDVSDAFCANDFGVVPVGIPTGTIAGGHAMTIVDYDRRSGSTVFDVVNSWGTGWGAGGFFRARPEYLAWDESRDFWFAEAAPYYSEATP